MSRPTPPTTVRIHGDDWKTVDVFDAVKSAWLMQWERKAWKPRAALIYKPSGKVSEDLGQAHDSKRATLEPKGWSHDHCCICWWTMTQSSDPEIGWAYTDGLDWMCGECCRQFLDDDLLGIHQSG